MKRKRVIPIALALLILAAGGVFIAFDPNARVQGWADGEPFFEGRSATSWRRALRQQDETAVTSARDALAAGKTDAVPVCAWLLAHAPESQVRWRTAEALGKMGKEVTAAGPPLIAALGDSDQLVRGVAAQAVGQLAPDLPGAVPALVKHFPDTGAIDAVALYKGAAAEALPQLVPLLKHEESQVRWKAAKAVGKIGPAAAAVVPELVAGMAGDTDPLVREHCAEALGDIGLKAADAVPALAKAARDENPKVRRDAVRSLGQVGPKAAEAMAEIRAATKDPEAIVRLAAAATLGQLGPAAKAALGDLAALTSDPEPRVRDAAARAARHLDPSAPPKQ